MTMTPSEQLLAEFVLEKSAAEPLPRRAALYRAIAATLGEAAPEFAALMRMADELDAVDVHHQQLLFRLRSE